MNAVYWILLGMIVLFAIFIVKAFLYTQRRSREGWGKKKK